MNIVKYLKQSNTQRQKVAWWLLSAGGGGESFFNGYRVSLWEDEKVLEMDGGEDWTPM